MALFPLSTNRQVQNIPMVSADSLIMSCIPHPNRSVWTKEQVRSLFTSHCTWFTFIYAGERPKDSGDWRPCSVGLYQELKQTTTLALLNKRWKYIHYQSRRKKWQKKLLYLSHARQTSVARRTAAGVRRSCKREVGLDQRWNQASLCPASWWLTPHMAGRHARSTNNAHHWCKHLLLGPER